VGGNPPGWRLQSPSGVKESRVLRGSRCRQLTGVRRQSSSSRLKPMVFGPEATDVSLGGYGNHPRAGGVESRCHWPPWGSAVSKVRSRARGRRWSSDRRCPMLGARRSIGFRVGGAEGSSSGCQRPLGLRCRRFRAGGVEGLRVFGVESSELEISMTWQWAALSLR
jgi:hypothetical protein